MRWSGSVVRFVVLGPSENFLIRVVPRKVEWMTHRKTGKGEYFCLMKYWITCSISHVRYGGCCASTWALRVIIVKQYLVITPRAEVVLPVPEMQKKQFCKFCSENTLSFQLELNSCYWFIRGLKLNWYSFFMFCVLLRLKLIGETK